MIIKSVSGATVISDILLNIVVENSKHWLKLHRIYVRLTICIILAQPPQQTAVLGEMPIKEFILFYSVKQVIKKVNIIRQRIL